MKAIPNVSKAPKPALKTSFFLDSRAELRKVFHSSLYHPSIYSRILEIKIRPVPSISVDPNAVKVAKLHTRGGALSSNVGMPALYNPGETMQLNAQLCYYGIS